MSELTERLAKWLHEHPLRELEERAIPAEVAPPDSYGEIVALFDGNRLGVQVGRDAKNHHCRLTAIDKVGCTALVHDAGTLPLIVEPKVRGAAFMTMLDYASGLEPDGTGPEPTLDDTEAPEALDALLIWSFVRRLEALLIEPPGLQRAYQSFETELRGTIRGRLRLDTYLGSNIPKGRADHVPCRFTQLDPDSAPNRALAFGLEYASAWAGRWRTSRGAAKLLDERCEALRPYLARVRAERVTSSQVRRIARGGRFATYGPTLDALARLLELIDIQLVHGDITLPEIIVDMPKLFEHFVEGVLRRYLQDGVRITAQRTLAVDIRWNTSPTNTPIAINPDLVLETDEPWCGVIDAKWKWSATNDATPSLPKPSTADLYQVLSYMRHKALTADVGVLVYPYAAHDDAIPRGEIEGFETVRGVPARLYLLGIPVDGDLTRRLPEFAHAVYALISPETTT